MEEFKDVKCKKCGNKITYWTIRDYIICQPCGAKIPVKPMKPKDDDGVR